jgi:hypothetical protein
LRRIAASTSSTESASRTVVGSERQRARAQIARDHGGDDVAVGQQAHGQAAGDGFVDHDQAAHMLFAHQPRGLVDAGLAVGDHGVAGAQLAGGQWLLHGALRGASRFQ